MKRKKILFPLCVVAAVIVLLMAFDVRLKTVQYNVSTDKLTQPIRIALITDLHSCKYGPGQSVLIDAVEQEQPDVVLFGGDIFDDILPQENANIVLKAMADQYPCYYSSGNHEFESGEIDTMKERIRSYGITILEGTCETIEIREQKINLCGIDDPLIQTVSETSTEDQLNNLQDAFDNTYYTILLAHRPSYIETYLTYGFDLVLAGHAHGGQWRIPFLLNGLLAPDEAWFPKYAGGKYAFSNGKMIVSRWLARESTRVPRIFNRPELVMIQLSNEG